MANVGLKAGSGVVEALTSVGPAIIICGIVVTLSPVMIGYLFGNYVLKLIPPILLGAITGAMTSTPSLNIVTTVLHVVLYPPLAMQVPTPLPMCFSPLPEQSS